MSAAIKLSSAATREFWEIPVLFEDEHLLALDKPAGVLVLPDPDQAERPSLMPLLHEGVTAGKSWASERKLNYLTNPHQLDFDVGGVLLLAKSKPVFMALADIFSSVKLLTRAHVALAWGVPPGNQFEVVAPLAPHPSQAGKMHVDPRNGKKATTQFEVLEQFSDWCLLRCLPETERPHQIRVHLKHAGFPVVGDEMYGGKKLWLSRLKKNYRLKEGREERPLLARPALHFETLTLTHPITRQPLTIQSERPKDLRVALKYLRQFRQG